MRVSPTVHVVQYSKAKRRVHSRNKVSGPACSPVHLIYMLKSLLLKHSHTRHRALHVLQYTSDCMFKAAGGLRGWPRIQACSCYLSASWAFWPQQLQTKDCRCQLRHPHHPERAEAAPTLLSLRHLHPSPGPHRPRAPRRRPHRRPHRRAADAARGGMHKADYKGRRETC